MNSLPKILLAVLAAATFAVAAPAVALTAGDDERAGPGAGVANGFGEPVFADHSAAQRGGMTLSQAVESVRRKGNVERVISAETKVSNGREVHVIKVLTKDGKVRTHRVPGRQRD